MKKRSWSRIFFGSYSLVSLLAALTLYSCNDEKEMPVVETGTVSDIQGNSYKTVKIGDQWWMAENLSVTAFSNGDPIRFVSSNDIMGWDTITVPAYSVYQDLISTPGKLYNFSVVTDNRNIAPPGWHVATDDDWKKLESFTGMSSTYVGKTGWRGAEGDVLKKAGLNYWSQYTGVWATDNYSFSANAGGCRLYDGRFSTPSGLTYTGFWWTSSDYQNGESWYRHMDYKSSGIFRSHTYHGYGMSIRCVKD
jgi:uncharacterized protein (TIGR02145 family)